MQIPNIYVGFEFGPQRIWVSVVRGNAQLQVQGVPSLKCTSTLKIFMFENLSSFFHSSCFRINQKNNLKNLVHPFAKHPAKQNN